MRVTVDSSNGHCWIASARRSSAPAALITDDWERSTPGGKDPERREGHRAHGAQSQTAIFGEGIERQPLSAQAIEARQQDHVPPEPRHQGQVDEEGQRRGERCGRCAVADPPVDNGDGYARRRHAYRRTDSTTWRMAVTTSAGSSSWM
jgi:hypothetical protein